MHRITAYVERDLETGLYVAVVPGIPGAHTNLKEAVELCLEEMEPEAKEALPEFVGIQTEEPLLSLTTEEEF